MNVIECNNCGSKDHMKDYTIFRKNNDVYLKCNCDFCDSKNHKYIGSGFISDTIDTVKAIILGRSEFPKNVRDYLKKKGNLKIIHLDVLREPIQETVKYFASLSTLGQIEKNIKDLGYDNIFHLSLHFMLEDNTEGIIEKNHVINIRKYEKKDVTQIMYVDVKGNITLNDLLLNAVKLYSGPREFNDYNAKTNNCQRFVFSLLEGSGMMNPELSNFIVQDAYKILKKTGLFETASKILTTIANRSDIIIKGKGIN